MVISAIVIADDRRASHRISNKDSGKNKLNIHENTVSGDANFSGILQQLKIIEDTHDG